MCLYWIYADTIVLELVNTINWSCASVVIESSNDVVHHNIFFFGGAVD